MTMLQNGKQRSPRLEYLIHKFHSAAFVTTAGFVLMRDYGAHFGKLLMLLSEVLVPLALATGKTKAAWTILDSFLASARTGKLTQPDDFTTFCKPPPSI